MRYAPHDLFFHTACFFLIGVLVASGTAAFTTPNAQILFIILATTLAAGILWLFNTLRLLPFTAIILLGVGYYLVYDSYRQNPAIAFNKEIIITGVVKDARHHLDSQELTLENRVKIYADRYPEFSYGDRIELPGAVQRSHTPFTAGTVNARYKKITLINKHNGNKIKEKLLAIKNAFENNLKKLLPHEQAAFLSGLTVGDTAEFSKKFTNELRRSGTTHLVALSGSNISYIVKLIAGILGYCMIRRSTFWPTIGIILLFVIMAGAESSLIRAAIMGLITLMAERYERNKNTRNAMTAAATIMVLYNPKLLVFDLGFQLSFLALAGITYIKPLFQKLPEKARTFFLADELYTALSAQAAVMPLLAITIGRTVPWSFIPNVLILPVIPPTIIIGFMVGILGFISPLIAFIPAWVVSILLRYEMEIIRLFAFAS